MEQGIKQLAGQDIKNVIKDFEINNPLKVDGRRRCTKIALSMGFSKKDIKIMRYKYLQRIGNKFLEKKPITHSDRVRFLSLVKECQYNPTATSSRYNCTGIDWKAFHRQSSNGKGWVLIAPDEPANNYYIEDNILVGLLLKKYK